MREKLLIITGEISGELHVVELLKQINRSDFSFYGMGSELLINAGVNLLINTRDLHIMGGGDLFRKAGKLYSAWKTLKKFIQINRPIVLLVDYPDFNLRLAKVAKQAGCKVLFLISPTLWAWRPGRIKIIRRWVDKMAVIYPFEVDYYRQRGIKVAYVGNVLVSKIENHLPLNVLKEQYQFKDGVITLGLFPGSRVSEIEYLLPVMLETSWLLTQKIKLQLVLSRASSIDRNLLLKYLRNYPQLVITEVTNPYDAITLSDVVLAASGTATLEIALSIKPLVLVYKGRWWEYLVAKLALNIPYVGLCNILAGQKVAPEFLQNQVDPKFLTGPLLRLLTDPVARQEQTEVFLKLKQQFIETPITSFKALVEELQES